MEAYRRLESNWASFNELDPTGMVCCASGTAALHLGIEALQLPPGSECVVPDFSMIACPRAVTLAGMTPVFVDCADDLNIDPKLIDKACNYDKMKWLDEVPYNVRAVMPVHIYGRRCKMDEICTLADKYDLFVIEDLAEAHGVKPHVDTDVACWSFYKNKIVAGEEGGAVWFKNPEAAKHARQLRSLGFTDAHDFTHIPRGHNYRMSNTHAELVLKSLERVVSIFNSRNRQFEWYDSYCPIEWNMYRVVSAPWVYPLRIKGMTSVQQDAVVKALQSVGIAARHAFKPMHRQQEYMRCRAVGPERQWGSLMAAKEVIYLPLSSTVEPCRLDAFDIVRRTLQNR